MRAGLYVAFTLGQIRLGNKTFIYRTYIAWRGRIFWELYTLTIIHKMYKVLYIGIIIIAWYLPENSPTADFQ